MAVKLNYTPLDAQRMYEGTYVPVEKEYGQSDMAALWEVSNATYSLAVRGDYLRKEYDTTEQALIPFNTEEKDKFIKAQGYSHGVANGLKQSYIEDWRGLEARAAYLTHLEEVESQVQDRVSTLVQLTVGTAMAIADPVAIGPVGAAYKGLKVATSALNTSSRGAKVAGHAIVGAGVAVAGTAALEASQGVYKDDSFVTSAAMGAALGGGIGFLLERAAPKVTTKDTDSAGNTLDTEEAKVQQVKTATKEVEDLERVIKDVEEIVVDANSAKEDLSKSSIKDDKKQREDNRLRKAITKASLSGARESLNAVRERVKASSGKYKKTKERLTTLKTRVKELKQSVRDNKALLGSLKEKESIVKRATLDIKSLQRKIKKLETTPRSKGKLTAAKSELKKLKTNLATDKAKVIVMKSSAKEHGKLTSKLKLTERQHLEQVDKVKLAKASHQEQLDAKKAATKKHKTAVDVNKKTKTFVGKGTGSPSKETLELEKELAKYSVDLSPEGLKKLISRKVGVESDLAKMEAGDYNLKALYGIQKKKETVLSKFVEELEEFRSKRDMRESDSFKRLPKWASKLIISPAEKLLNSPSSAVSEFTRLLTTGTLYHGKVNTRTAWVITQEHGNRLGNMHSALTHYYKQAVTDGYKGKRAQFDMEVSDNAIKVAGTMQRDAYKGLSALLTEQQKREIAISRTEGLERKYSSTNEHINKATDEYLDYYEYIHKVGKGLEMESFTGSLGKGYIPRAYDKDKILGLDKDPEVAAQLAIQLLVDAQRSKAVESGVAITSEVQDEFLGLATAAVRGTIDGSIRRAHALRPLGNERSSASSLHKRTIDVYDDDLSSILSGDILGVSSIYGLKLHGKLALMEKLGVKNSEEAKAMIKELGTKDFGDGSPVATAKEQELMVVLIETIQGVREIAKDPFSPFSRATKMLSTYTSALHTPAFVLPSLTEASSIAKEFGWKRTVDKLSVSLPEMVERYRKGSVSDKNSMEMYLSYGEAYMSGRANRAELETSLGSVGKAQEFLDDVVKFESIYAGLQPVTDAYRMASASLTVDFLARMSVAKNISATDLKRLEGIGFDKESLKLVRDTLQVSSDGRIGNPNRKTWGKLDEEISAAVITMVEKTILAPNGMTLPPIMTNMDGGAVVPRILMKFMRFPIESYERLFLRGIQEADAKQLMALGGNIAMWTGILAMKDVIKDEEDREFTGKDWETKLMTQSFLSNSVTTGPIAFANMAYGAVTGENLTNNYSFRPGSVVLNKINDTRKGEVNVSIPFTKVSIDIGEAANSAFGTLAGLEELNKE